MSSQKGNVARNRPQKYRNRSAFKNNLHDTSNRTKLINNVQVNGVCVRCKEIIEWKIKYKKYKPLTQPRTCVKCSQKVVKQAYHVMCLECGNKLGVCTKCCQVNAIMNAGPSKLEQVKLDNELKTLLQSLPERKRRTFIRYMNKNKGSAEGDQAENLEENKRDMLSKLHSLKVDDDSEPLSDDEHVDNDDDDKKDSDLEDES